MCNTYSKPGVALRGYLLKVDTEEEDEEGEDEHLERALFKAAVTRRLANKSATEREGKDRPCE